MTIQPSNKAIEAWATELSNDWPEPDRTDAIELIKAGKLRAVTTSGDPSLIINEEDDELIVRLPAGPTGLMPGKVADLQAAFSAAQRAETDALRTLVRSEPFLAFVAAKTHTEQVDAEGFQQFPVEWEEVVETVDIVVRTTDRSANWNLLYGACGE